MVARGPVGRGPGRATRAATRRPCTGPLRGPVGSATCRWLLGLGVRGAAAHGLPESRLVQWVPRPQAPSPRLVKSAAARSNEGLAFMEHLFEMGDGAATDDRVRER